MGRMGVAARVFTCIIKPIKSQQGVNEAEISSSSSISIPHSPLRPSLHLPLSLDGHNTHASNALNNSVTVASFCNTNIIALNMDRCNEALPALK